MALMKSGDAPATSTISNDPNINSNGRERPTSHLQDLAPEDLPVENRGIITSEIALFRESAAKRAAEKKRLEQEQEARRNASRANQAPSGGVRPQSQQEPGNGWGARGQVDPQSYNKPVGFIAAGTSISDSNPLTTVKLSDADNERARIEQSKRASEANLRDVSIFLNISLSCYPEAKFFFFFFPFYQRERRLEARERTRISGVERERARERSVIEQQDRDRISMRERLASWDDVKEAEKGRETFYNDR